MRLLPPRALVLLLAVLCGSACDRTSEPAPIAVEPEPVAPSCEKAPPPATPTRLLTRAEYDNTVRDLLGLEGRPSSTFPKEPQVQGFENNVAAHRVNETLVRAYLETAEQLSYRAVTDQRARLLPCEPAAVGAGECGRQFLSQLLPRAYRRPPAVDELQALRSFFDQTLAQHGFDAAVQTTLEVVLQSPQFLYRVEAGLPAADGTYQLTGYALASRLSYFLWSSMPDDALLLAAADGRLSTRQGLLEQVRRLLADPKANDTVQSFFRQWLHLDGIDKLEKSAPEFSPAVAQGWRRGVERFLEEVFWNGAGNLKTLFGSNVVFLDEATAPLYGLTSAGRYDFPAHERSGLLTQPGVMAMLAGPLSSSPVKRGVFVRERLLCQPLPSPPDGAAVVAPDPAPGITTRERFAEHTANAACAACHALIDPVGFGFEHYDSLGRWRSSEDGLPIDASGNVSAVEDSALAGPFSGADGLSSKLSRSVTVSNCVTTQWFRFAFGRLETEADACALDEMQDRLLDSGGDVRELLVAIALSDAFRTRAAPVEEAP